MPVTVVEDWSSVRISGGVPLKGLHRSFNDQLAVAIEQLDVGAKARAVNVSATSTRYKQRDDLLG